MSTLASVTTECTACHHEVRGEIGLVVNCDRRADLRARVLDGTFNRLRCEACGHVMSVSRTVAFWDWANRRFVVCYPRWAERHWADLARATSESLHRNLALAAPPAFAAATTEFTVRVVFGYDGLREKFVAWDAGLDDAAVERAKVAFVGTRPDLARKPIWLVEVTPEALVFVVAGKPPERIEGPRDWLDARLPLGMSSLELMADPFVDHRRWLVPPVPANPLEFDLTGGNYVHAGGAVLREPFHDV